MPPDPSPWAGNGDTWRNLLQKNWELAAAEKNFTYTGKHVMQ